MSYEKCWYIKQIDLFAGVSDAEIKKIANQVTQRKCRKKELIYTPEESNNAVYILKKGEVTLYNSHLGKRLVIDVLTPGAVFGNINFQAQSSTHFAEVTEDALMCVFPMEDFMKIVQAKPEITFNLLNIMSQRLQDYENRMKSGLFDAKEKILHALKLLHTKQKPNLLSKVFPQQQNRLTHEKLSHHTGLTRETITRAISDLKKEGRIAETLNGYKVNY